MGAGGVVRAILAQTKQGGAFEQLREYVVPRRLLAAEDRSTASPDPEAILEMAVTPVLGESLLAIPDYVRTSGWRMWGRGPHHGGAAGRRSDAHRPDGGRGHGTPLRFDGSGSRFSPNA